MAILIPCCAKYLLSGVLSMTPGNLFALQTWNGWLNTEASTGAEAPELSSGDSPSPPLGMSVLCRFTKVNLRRNQPSVRTLRSCSTNQMPSCFWRSFSLKALALKLPIRLRVYIPLVLADMDRGLPGPYGPR